MNTLILTKAEQALFQSLPAALQEGWSVESETMSRFESDRQLRMRISMADFSLFPDLQELMKGIVDGRVTSLPTIDDIPEDVQKELYFTIGARGVDAMIRTLINEIRTDDDVHLLSVLSQVRHQLLEINENTTHS